MREKSIGLLNKALALVSFVANTHFGASSVALARSRSASG
jgi:hypothetical protein